MKKYLFFVAAFLMLLMLAADSKAVISGIPKGPDNQIPTSDYGGVSYSTQAILGSTNPVILMNSNGILVGFVATSNTANSDYLSFYDTGAVATNSDIAATQEVFRVYLSSVSSTPPYSSTFGTVFKFPVPVRFVRGLAARANVSNITLIRFLVQQYED